MVVVGGGGSGRGVAFKRILDPETCTFKRITIPSTRTRPLSVTSCCMRSCRLPRSCCDEFQRHSILESGTFFHANTVVGRLRGQLRGQMQPKVILAAGIRGRLVGHVAFCPALITVYMFLCRSHVAQPRDVVQQSTRRHFVVILSGLHSNRPFKRCQCGILSACPESGTSCSFALVIAMLHGTTIPSCSGMVGITFEVTALTPHLLQRAVFQRIEK